MTIFRGSRLRKTATKLARFGSRNTTTPRNIIWINQAYGPASVAEGPDSVLIEGEVLQGAYTSGSVAESSGSAWQGAKTLPQQAQTIELISRHTYIRKRISLTLFIKRLILWSKGLL